MRRQSFCKRATKTTPSRNMPNHWKNKTSECTYRHQATICRRFLILINLSNSELLNKNTQLRESLARVRLSRESFKSRLKNAHSLHRTMEGSQRRFKVNGKLMRNEFDWEKLTVAFNHTQNTWSDLKQVETLLQQKENHVQSVHLKYLGEIEKLTRKLQQRDDTLKKVLRSTAATATRSKERKDT